MPGRGKNFRARHPRFVGARRKPRRKIESRFWRVLRHDDAEFARLFKEVGVSRRSTFDGAQMAGLCVIEQRMVAGHDGISVCASRRRDDPIGRIVVQIAGQER